MIKFIHLLAVAFAASVPSPIVHPATTAAPRRNTNLKAHRAMTWDGYRGRNHASSM